MAFISANPEEFDRTDFIPDQDDDDTLGSCGCVDYHMADCPIRTGGSGMTADDYMAMYSRRDYDEYYDQD